MIVNFSVTIDIMFENIPHDHPVSTWVNIYGLGSCFKRGNKVSELE